MAELVCHCGFGEEYFTLEGNRSICSVCGGDVAGRTIDVFDSPEAGSESGAAPGTRVLVIDDQPFFRLRIRDILEQTRHQIIEAGDGIEAVRALAAGLRSAAANPSERVALAILDLNMPGLIDGFQTLGVLKAMDENLPVLILTASAPTPELLKKLGQLKAKKYLNKSSKNLEELLLRNLEGTLGLRRGPRVAMASRARRVACQHLGGVLAGDLQEVPPLAAGQGPAALVAEPRLAAHEEGEDGRDPLRFQKRQQPGVPSRESAPPDRRESEAPSAGIRPRRPGAAPRGSPGSVRRTPRSGGRKRRPAPCSSDVRPVKARAFRGEHSRWSSRGVHLPAAGAPVNGRGCIDKHPRLSCWPCVGNGQRFMTIRSAARRVVDTPRSGGADA